MLLIIYLLLAIYSSPSNGLVACARDAESVLTSTNVTALQIAAHGKLPSIPPPAIVSSDGIASLQLLNYIGNFEVALLQDIISNIHDQIPGYAIENAASRTRLLNTLETLLAQEQVYRYKAAAALKLFNHEPVTPCCYSFPATSMEQALRFAISTTDLILGTLQDIAERFAISDEPAIVRYIAAITGQVGKQRATLRQMLLNDSVPLSDPPFPTTATRELALSFFSSMDETGHCLTNSSIALRILHPLALATQKPINDDQDLEFTIASPACARDAGPSLACRGEASAADDRVTVLRTNASITYINQFDAPVSVPLRVVIGDSNQVRLSASFPYRTKRLFGQTLAIVTQHGGFSTVTQATASALYGPVLIEIDNDASALIEGSTASVKAARWRSDA